jgi:hypothetical protein
MVSRVVDDNRDEEGRSARCMKAVLPSSGGTIQSTVEVEV